MSRIPSLLPSRGEGGAQRRMRAAMQSIAVFPSVLNHRCYAPALIRPSGTFSQAALGRREGDIA